MYRKYGHYCPPPVKLQNTPPYCKTTAAPGVGAIPESMRMFSQRCPNAWVATQTDPACLTSNPDVPAPAPAVDTPRVKIVQIPVAPGAEMPYVSVQTVPASNTVQQRAQAVIALATDSYNPDTRFSQYFPPAPIPYECPERIPNNEPKPSTADCIPITRFHGSAQ